MAGPKPESVAARSWRARLLALVAGTAGRRALVVALVVGSLLNLINQSEALLGGAQIDWLKLTLTYIVPYCVSLHGAVSAARA